MQKTHQLTAYSRPLMGCCISINNLPYEKIGKNEPVCIADEVPFEIPDSWEWVRLSTICTKLVDGDHNPPKGVQEKTVYIMASSTNINNDMITELDKVRYLSRDVFKKENERTFATKGDIFFTSVGSLGRSCVYEGGLNICFQRSVTVITTLIYNCYLKYCFDSAYIQQKVVREATGTAQKGFYLNQLASVLIPVPPLNEQYRIVSKYLEISPTQKKYEVLNSQIDNLNAIFPDQLKKSILQYAVQGKLVPQDPNDEPASVLLERIRAEKEQLIKAGRIKRDKHESVIIRRDNSYYEISGKSEVCSDDEIPFEIPDSWAWARLSSFGIFSSGKTPSMSNPSFWDGNIPWVSSKDMKRSIIIDSEMHITALAASTMQIYPAGTLLLVARSGILKRLLPLCVLGVDSTINQDIKAFSLYDLRLSEWLYYGIKAFEPYILKELVKSVTTVESLRFDEFSRMLIPVPPLAEQKRIESAIKEAMDLLRPLSNDPLFLL